MPDTVCGLCGICPAPLGICIFIWCGAFLLVFCAVSFVKFRKRVKKYREQLEREEERRRKLEELWR